MFYLIKVMNADTKLSIANKANVDYTYANKAKQQPQEAEDQQEQQQPDARVHRTKSVCYDLGASEDIQKEKILNEITKLKMQSPMKK